MSMYSVKTKFTWLIYGENCTEGGDGGNGGSGGKGEYVKDAVR